MHCNVLQNGCCLMQINDTILLDACSFTVQYNVILCSVIVCCKIITIAYWEINDTILLEACSFTILVWPWEGMCNIYIYTCWMWVVQQCEA